MIALQYPPILYKRLLRPLDGYLRENIPIILFCLLYGLAVFLTTNILNVSNSYQIQFNYKFLNYATLYFSSLFLSYKILIGEGHHYLNIKRFLNALTIFLLLPIFKCSFASYKQSFTAFRDFCFDKILMETDYIIHFNNHPWELLRPLIKMKAAVLFLDLIYVFWFLFLLFFCLWMAWSKRTSLRIQFFISCLSVWIFLGSGLGTVLSSAGPCYYSKVVKTEADPYGEQIKILREYHSENPLFAIKNQDGLWKAKIEQEWLPFGGISAMPSIHVAMAILFVLTAFRVNILLGIIFSIYAVLIQIGSVILGWHYAMDGYMAIVLTTLVWKIAGYNSNSFGQKDDLYDPELLHHKKGPPEWKRRTTKVFKNAE